MPLPPPAPREALHDRTIHCRGYRRADGLWDIEARLVDAKTYPFTNAHRGTIAPGEPLHEMALRLTIDDAMTIRAVAATTDAAPFAECPAITPAFRALEGVTIGPGWSRAVRARLGGVKGCTHLLELLRPIATVAFQTVWSGRAARASADDRTRRPAYIGRCHTLKSDGTVVRRHFPEWYTGPAD